MANEELKQCISMPIQPGEKGKFIIQTLSKRWDTRVNWKPIVSYCYYN